MLSARIRMIMSMLGLAVAMLLLVNPSETLAKGPQSRPLKGTFSAFTPVQVQDDGLELLCTGGLFKFEGADAIVTGNVSHLGKTVSTISLALDWGTPAAGVYTPVGPTTSSSATVVGVHAFNGQVFPAFGCNNPWATTGIVTLTAANGDQVTGTISGGEVYELGFVVAGDGQESFVAVTITGGTGRFAGATGSFVTHTIVDIFAASVISNELSGTIGY